MFSATFIMIRVLIERQIAEGLAQHYDQISLAFLQEAMKFPGFISGESLKDYFNSDKRILLSNWRSIEDWNKWFYSEQRKQSVSKINVLLDREEKLTILELSS